MNAIKMRRKKTMILSSAYFHLQVKNSMEIKCIQENHIVK